jgi:hypothetical protein
VAHAQTYAKVNAPVDPGIKPLVEALSLIPELETIESCQGEPQRSQAFVMFRFPDWKMSGIFVFERLMPALPSEMRARVAIDISAYDSDHAIVRVAADPLVIKDLADLVKKRADQLRP